MDPTAVRRGRAGRNLEEPMTAILATLAVSCLYRCASDLMRQPLTVGACVVALGWGASLGCFLDLATCY